MFDDLTIPDFLRRTPESCVPSPQRKRLRWTHEMNFKDKPSREEEAATKKLRREIEKAKADKRKAALQRLRENYGKKKR